MFMEADPEIQGTYMKRAFEAEVDQEVQATVDAALAEQRRRIKARKAQK